jgi:hypothetical protein
MTDRKSKGSPLSEFVSLHSVTHRHRVASLYLYVNYCVGVFSIRILEYFFISQSVSILNYPGDFSLSVCVYCFLKPCPISKPGLIYINIEVVL